MIKLFEKFINTNEENTRIELLYVIHNLTITCDPMKLLEFLLDNRDIIFLAILNCLDVKNHTKLLILCLNTIEHWLKLGFTMALKLDKDSNEILEEFIQQENIINLEILQNHPNSKISNKANEIIETFLPINE